MLLWYRLDPCPRGSATAAMSDPTKESCTGNPSKPTRVQNLPGSSTPGVFPPRPSHASTCCPCTETIASHAHNLLLCCLLLLLALMPLTLRSSIHGSATSPCLPLPAMPFLVCPLSSPRPPYSHLWLSCSRSSACKNKISCSKSQQGLTLGLIGPCQVNPHASLPPSIAHWPVWVYHHY